LNKVLFFGILSRSNFTYGLDKEQEAFYGFFCENRDHFLQTNNKDLDYFLFKHLFALILATFKHDYTYDPFFDYNYDKLIVDFFFSKLRDISKFFPENNFIENWPYLNRCDDLFKIVNEILGILEILEKEEFFKQKTRDSKKLFEERKAFLLGVKDLRFAIDFYDVVTNELTNKLEVLNINDIESAIKRFLSFIEKSGENNIIKSRPKNVKLLKKI